MPFLDVSELLTDPDFCEKISVLRRTQTIGNDGNAVESENNLYLIGVVTAGAMTNYDIDPNSERARNFITVHMKHHLFGPSNGQAADIIEWAGNQYVVRKFNNWSKYGRGFFAAECEMIDLESA